MSNKEWVKVKDFYITTAAWDRYFNSSVNGILSIMANPVILEIAPLDINNIVKWGEKLADKMAEVANKRTVLGTPDN